MKRHAARRHWAGLFAACVIPLIHCGAAAGAAELYAQQGGAVSAWAHTAVRNPLRLAQPAVMPSRPPPAYFGDVPVTVVGVYGATMLDMLSGGPLLLVRWPNECCSARQRWHTRRPTDSMPADANGAHIFFLWPQA
jgi:hypothetical protein